ncbi:sulfite exporter TauE/SafE family protein [Vibrio sp. YIC-376]|uniref:sulfite exporter TauE/SafE family protein n=1 Tax=Vibrio sp. YIC-376 TaxID=3136162 RepID=UPI00402A73F3
MYLLMYLLLGTCSGVLAGLFGIGGGIIIVPVLVFSFTAQGIPPEVLTHLAVGTSLSVILFTSVNSVLAHHKKGAVNWTIVRWLSVGIIVGSAAGGVTASLIPGAYLQQIIGVFAVVMALQMWFGWKPKKTASALKKSVLSVAGVVIGWASAIFGVGGGSLMVPFLSWNNVEMRNAVAISAACGMPIAFSGTCSFIMIGSGLVELPEYSLGYIYLPALAGIAITSMWSARIGAKLAHRLDPELLKKLFSMLLLGVGVNFLV